MTWKLDYDVIIIGGGPAGLSAALYLARYDRHTALFDLGAGRSSGHQTAHNFLGFPGGVPARRLRELGYQQLADYPQVDVINCGVDAVERSEAGFAAVTEAGVMTARAVILCTGVVDRYPDFADCEDYVGRSLFWCITCDGYGCKGQRVVVVGSTNAAASEALQLQRFTDQLTVLTNDDECRIEPRFVERLARAGIPLVQDRIADVIGRGGYFEALTLASGRRLELDQLFSQQGATPRSQFAAALGAELNLEGYIEIDAEQRTTVPFLYAAGDVTRPHAHQISAAVYEGGQAASSANYDLYPPDLKDD